MKEKGVGSNMVQTEKFKGKYCESDFENTFLALLVQAGWQYLPGRDIPRRTQKDVLYEDDLEEFLSRTHGDLEADDIRAIIDQVRLAGGVSDFAVLHKVYGWLDDGIQYKPEDGEAQMVSLIDFDHPERNIFRAVNQFTVEYKDHGDTHERRPDILLFVNGIPLCVMELKNPADENATIYDAWEQINIRYWRDIPSLLHYCPLACISDGVKTRLGTVRAPYEHFYAWRRVNEEDKITPGPFNELDTIVRGVYAPSRFLEIFRDYIYFQDSRYDDKEVEIVCRYPQFFASKLLKNSIIKSVETKSGKGGTYFGATGCGKTYTMAFLARQLALRCTDIPAIGSPTILLIVDRDDLQKQSAKLFTKSCEFLNLGEVKVVASRNDLRQELKARESGGFYICTIQKFCDREDDPIGFINGRSNIICFSDEAHRTQLERAKEIKFTKDMNNNMRAMLSKPYAKVLREALPHATFVGFTGTPIDETYQTFGEEIDRYTMDQAVADGLTVPIKYHPRITKVLLDNQKVKEIENYYRQCAESGATAEDVEKSKKAMSSMEVILEEPSRLERLATDIHDHYVSSCADDPDRVQKAMVVCSTRKIAFTLLNIFKKKYPDWFVPKKSVDDSALSPEELHKLAPMPFMAMVASVGKNDPKDMYDYLGGTRNDKRSEELGAMFKEDSSNFHIVIVVDMWVTGFDVPCLTYMYNDKPLEKHMLIQTISRVNRKYPGKEYGLVIDYIGIRENMRAAVKMYGGENSVAPSADDIEQATDTFREKLHILEDLFKGYDLSPFLNPDEDPVERYRLLTQAAEYVFESTLGLSIETKGGKGVKTVLFKDYFLYTVKQMRAAYNLCQPSGELGEKETALAQCFMAIAGFVRKMGGTSDVDADSMNRHVSKMVEEALKYSKVENVLSDGEEEDILSPEYLENLKNIRLPATKLEVLVKLLRKQISTFGKTNRVAAKRYQEMLEKTIQEYHERRKHLSAEEVGATQEETTDEIIKAATEQAMEIMRKMKKDRESFRKLNLTFEEKAFYDILIKLRNDHNFEYGEDKTVDGIIVNEKCRALAKKIKEIIDTKSSFTDWLNNQIVRDQLKFDIKVCLIKNGYPPRYSPEVFRDVMDQVENFAQNRS